MTLRTVLLAAIVGTGLAGLVVGFTVELRLPGDNSGYQPAQPIAYSHRLHAGENKIDCQFCHTAAEKSRHAGIPPVSTCMKCHEKIVNRPNSNPKSPELSTEIAKLTKAFKEGQPIQWQRVHRLPAFAFFDHSRHVNGGITCQTCHGEIQTMDAVTQARSFTMGDCLNCHRDQNQKRLAAGKPPAAPTNCSACHH